MILWDPSTLLYIIVHHSYCHINLVKKTLYQRDIEKVGIYILYLPSDIQVQKYLEDLMKNILSSFLIYSISKSRTTLNYNIETFFLDVEHIYCNLEFILVNLFCQLELILLLSFWNTSQLVNCRIDEYAGLHFGVLVLFETIHIFKSERNRSGSNNCLK